MQERSTKELEKELSSCNEISDFLAQNQVHMHECSVSEQLRYYMEKKALSRSDVIARSGLNDIYAHQILSGKRRPSRDKLLCLCFGSGFVQVSNGDHFRVRTLLVRSEMAF